MKMDLRGSLRIVSMVFLLFEFIVSDYSCSYFSDNKDNDLNAGKGITSLHEFISLMRNIIYTQFSIQASTFIFTYVILIDTENCAWDSPTVYEILAQCKDLEY